MKRFLSLILCVLMVVAIVPMGLFVATAAESDEFQQLMIYENNFESSSKLVDDENTVISDATNVVWNNNGVVQLTGSSKSPYKNSTWERTFDISQTQNGKVKFEVRCPVGRGLREMRRHRPRISPLPEGDRGDLHSLQELRT